MDDASGAPATGHGTVFVAEGFDDEANPSGRFAAHWESEDGARWRQGPQGVTAGDAVAWARGQAGVVIVRTGDGDAYSAGDTEVADVPTPWPAAGLTFAARPLASHWDVIVHTGGDVPVRYVVEAPSAPAAARVAHELLPADVDDRPGVRYEVAVEVVGPASRPG